MRCKTLLLIFAAFLFATGTNAQLLTSKENFTHADSLRGTLNANRAWWDVLRYDLEVEPDYKSQTIVGRNTIRFQSMGGSIMQLDLQQPLICDSILLGTSPVSFQRDDNIMLLHFAQALKAKQEYSLVVYYHGKPRKAIRPPWDGGWIWTKDAKGRPWMTVACQGLGASVWYPCKDHQSDEPDQGASLTVVVPDTLMAVANGRLISRIKVQEKTAYRWEVRNPINNYDLIPYIGKYESFGETFNGEDGNLSCTYWVLDYNLDKAKEQFKQVTSMLQCFEYWFGPYPFYEDGYQLVEAPHLGMEHQSAVAYGNKFMNGYLGRDLSGTGWGSKWDFIIVHESGHEWFGNNITTKDLADMWVHEGFTNYSETIYTQCQSGLEAGQEYVQGIRKNIANDKPIIGPYGVNKEGSPDMYYKGANLIHTIRTIMNNDSLFRKMLRDMNKTFYHQTVTTQQIEQFIGQHTSFDCKPIFDQYLRNTSIPTLQWKKKDGQLLVRFTNCIENFSMPVFLPQTASKGVWKKVVSEKWTSVSCTLSKSDIVDGWNRNLYINYGDEE
jgi:aminopeptidase N